MKRKIVSREEFRAMLRADIENREIQKILEETKLISQKNKAKFYLQLSTEYSYMGSYQKLIKGETCFFNQSI